MIDESEELYREEEVTVELVEIDGVKLMHTTGPWFIDLTQGRTIRDFAWYNRLMIGVLKDEFHDFMSATTHAFLYYTDVNEELTKKAFEMRNSRVDKRASRLSPNITTK
jgi:hypothetical protein